MWIPVYDINKGLMKCIISGVWVVHVDFGCNIDGF